MNNNIDLLLKFFYSKVALVSYIWELDNDDILNKSESINLYPFEDSFDEVSLKISEWVNKSLKEDTMIDFQEFHISKENYKKELLRNLISLKNAFEEISLYKDELEKMDSYKYYPFSTKLDDVNENVKVWIENTIKEIA